MCAAVDAGHGHANNLAEVALQNLDGVYLTTTQADISAAGAQALNAVPSVIPASATADFSSVNLYDLPGPTTWPITMISYFYLNQDLTDLDPTTAGLLIYFVNYILSVEGQALAVSNSLVGLPPSLIAYNAVAMATLVTPPGTPTFTSEISTQSQIGAGTYVISNKRRDFDEVRGERNAAAISTIQTEETARSQQELCVRGRCFDMEMVQVAAITGLVIGCVGFILAFFACIMAACLCCTSRAQKPRSVEIPARDLKTPSSTADAV